MERRPFSREFKPEAVGLIKELTSDRGQAFPGQGQPKPEQREIDRPRREVARLKAERGILKRPRLLGEAVDVKFGFVAEIEGSGRCKGFARRSMSRAEVP